MVLIPAKDVYAFRVVEVEVSAPRLFETVYEPQALAARLQLQALAATLQLQSCHCAPSNVLVILLFDVVSGGNPDILVTTRSGSPALVLLCKVLVHTSVLSCLWR